MTGAYPELAFALTCFAIAAALIVLGFVLRRRGILHGRMVSLGWVLLCGVPLLVSIGHAYSQKMPETAPGSAASQLG